MAGITDVYASSAVAYFSKTVPLRPAAPGFEDWSVLVCLEPFLKNYIKAQRSR